jgi:hypothetical protein
VKAAPRGDERRVLELRIRPHMRGNIELRLLIEALLSAAKEELERRSADALQPHAARGGDAERGGSGEAA